jgi:NTP pyrophosphatase (non-canonical NTP hydrolase)
MTPIDFDFLDQCKKITKDYEKLKGRWSADAQILHVIDETMEFWDALRKKTHADMQEEWADIILTTIAAANYFGISNHQIRDALNNKLEIVKKRVEDVLKE